MSEAATMVRRVTSFTPATGATMGAVKCERILFVPKPTLIAGVLAVTMVSPPVFASTTWPSREGGETVNRDLALADDSNFENAEVDLDTLHPESELQLLPAGFRLASLESPPPFVDPDLLALDED